MNRKQLNQAYYLTKELEMWERKLREAEANDGVGSPVITGMPFANTNLNSDPTARAAMDLAKIRETVQVLRDNVIRELKEISEYVASLDDPFLRQIIHYRCYELMSWNQIAIKIGGGNSAENIRQYFHRHVEK